MTPAALAASVAAALAAETEPHAHAPWRAHGVAMAWIAAYARLLSAAALLAGAAAPQFVSGVAAAVGEMLAAVGDDGPGGEWPRDRDFEAEAEAEARRALAAAAAAARRAGLAADDFFGCVGAALVAAVALRHGAAAARRAAAEAGLPVSP